jgi:uncharacterized protein YdeI (YjbR/CyaY-like superfamily)
LKDYPDVDAYLADSTKWPAEIATIRPILLSCGLDEAIKWGKPCYRTELPPRLDEEVAVELQERLANNDALAAAFNELTPGRQREYNLHISGAKQAATRNGRIDKVEPRILQGKGLRDR